MKIFIIAVITSLILGGCTTSDTNSNKLLGRYETPAINAGISLTLLEKGIFIADWWGQENINGDILEGWTSGSWHREGSNLILRYVTNQTESEAVFMVEEKNGKQLLRLIQSGEFPFITFFGDEYPMEQAHAETFEMSLKAIQKRREMELNQQPCTPQ